MCVYAPPGELIKVSDIGDALVYLKYESPTFVDEDELHYAKRVHPGYAGYAPQHFNNENHYHLVKKFSPSS
jgi:hypothetical protein